VSHGMT